MDGSSKEFEMEPAPEQREVEGRGGAFWYEVPH